MSARAPCAFSFFLTHLHSSQILQIDCIESNNRFPLDPATLPLPEINQLPTISIMPAMKYEDKAEEKQANEEQLPPLTTGIPPWHSFAYVATALAMTIPSLPSLEEIDAMSHPSVWTTRKFPDLVSPWGLAVVRLGIAGVALSLTLYLVLIDPGWDVYPNYKPRSKLRKVFIRLEGIGTMCPFTSWSWMILGLGFLCRGILAIAAAATADAGEAPPPEWVSSVFDNQNFLRVTLILWELTGPFAILVSCVVKYVIWPEAIKGGKPHKLAGVRNQLQHNCNSMFALLEVTLLGGMSVKFTHLSLATFVCVIYISFTWIMARLYFGNKTVGPQYIYWFLDTTLEQTTTIALVALTVALMVFFVLFSLVVGMVLGYTNTGEDVASSPPSLVLNLAFLVTGTFLVCKFKN
jgi:hypothetical protein